MTEEPRQRRATSSKHQREDDGTSPSARLRLGKGLTEYFSVVTAASLVLSILANQMVFDRWGLNFLQLATFTDVAMSGLALLFFTVPLAIALLVAWFAGGLKGRFRWLPRIALGLAVLILALGIWGIARGQADQGAAAAVSASGVVITGLLGQTAWRFRRHRSLGGGIIAALTVVLAGFTLAQTMDYTVQKYRVGGYAGSVPLYLIPAAPDCVARALWTGERAMVLDCGDRGDPSDIRVVFGQDNGLYSTVRPTLQR